MNDSLTREEKKVAILSKLARKNKIGMNYIPIEKTLSKIPSHARGDIEDVIDEMYKDGLLEYHKNRDCISLRPEAISKVVELIKEEVPDYIVEKLK